MSFATSQKFACRSLDCQNVDHGRNKNPCSVRGHRHCLSVEGKCLIFDMFEIPNWHLKQVLLIRFSCVQFVSRIDSMLRVKNWKEQERTGSARKFLVAATISKGKDLSFAEMVIHNPKVGSSILPPATNPINHLQRSD